VGVRRFARILENGNEAKNLTDKMVRAFWACAHSCPWVIPHPGNHSPSPCYCPAETLGVDNLAVCVVFCLGLVRFDHPKPNADRNSCWQVDMCGSLVNLRTSIMRYRKPQGNSRFHRCREISSHETINHLYTKLVLEN